MNIPELRTIARWASEQSTRFYTIFTGLILRDLEIAFGQLF